MNIIIMSKSAIVNLKYFCYILCLQLLFLYIWNYALRGCKHSRIINAAFARFIKTFPKKLQKNFTAKSAFLTVSLFLDFHNPESWGCKYATSFFSR